MLVGSGAARGPVCRVERKQVDPIAADALGLFGKGPAIEILDIPKPSMYGIYAYIDPCNHPNVGK